jgi:hypothetical protein
VRAIIQWHKGSFRMTFVQLPWSTNALLWIRDHLSPMGSPANGSGNGKNNSKHADWNVHGPKNDA